MCVCIPSCCVKWTSQQTFHAMNPEWHCFLSLKSYPYGQYQIKFYFLLAPTTFDASIHIVNTIHICMQQTSQTNWPIEPSTGIHPIHFRYLPLIWFTLVPWVSAMYNGDVAEHFYQIKKNWKYTNTDSTLYRPNIFHSVSATNYFGRDAIEILIANQSKFIDHWFGTEVEKRASPNLQETISQTLSEKEQNNRDNHPVNTTETMSRITPVASPSPPLRSASRHQTSPQLKSNFSDLSIHRKSSEPICESPTDFQLLTTKSTDAYQDEEQFPANCKKQCISLLLFFVGIQQSAHWTRQNEKEEIWSGKQEERPRVLLVCSARIAFNSFSLCLFRSS